MSREKVFLESGIFSKYESQSLLRFQYSKPRFWLIISPLFNSILGFLPNTSIQLHSFFNGNETNETVHAQGSTTE